MPTCVKRKATEETTSRKRRSTTPNEEEEDSDDSTDFLDLSAYGFDIDHDASEEASPLKWSLDNADGLSDWTISVSPLDSDDSSIQEIDETMTYFVHKNFLAGGKNKSDYFVKLFHTLNNDNPMQEFATSTTTLKLEQSACEAFPELLNFLYSQDGTAEINTSNAVALRHLAHYFGIQNLFVQTTAFIDNEFETKVSKAAPLYLMEATCYHDSRLASFAVNRCASTMESIDPVDFMILTPDLARKIFQSENLVASSTHLSRIAAAYLEAHAGEIDKDLFQTMTRETIMDQICPNAAISLLKSLADLQENKHSSNPTTNWKRSLKTRCKKSLSKSWQEVIVTSLSGGVGPDSEVAKNATTSHRVLPPTQQIEILEDSILQASKDMKKMKTAYEQKMIDWKKEVETINNDMKQLKMNYEQKMLEWESEKETIKNNMYLISDLLEEKDLLIQEMQQNRKHK